MELIFLPQKLFFFTLYHSIKRIWNFFLETLFFESLHKWEENINLLLVALGLHCCAHAFSSCGKRGLLSSCGTQVPHCDGFSCCGAWALGFMAWEVAAHGLSLSTACGILSDQGLNHIPFIGRQILSHWATREVPPQCTLIHRPKL